MSKVSYGRPTLRKYAYREDLPKVIVAHEHRFVAPALHEALAGNAEVVGDTPFGMAAVQLASMLSPSVVVAGELLIDGAIEHFLPELARAGMRVLLIMDEPGGQRVLDLVRSGLCGACSTGASLAQVADSVLEVANGRAILPPSLVADIVTQWRSGLNTGQQGEATALTLRELEVFNAMAGGLSTKATARLLGLAPKTVESHKTHVFAKLGLRNQAELVAKAGGRLVAG